MNAKQILVESLDFCIKEKGLILNGWVIMSNHVHLIASAKEGFELAGVIRDFKKYTSRMVVASIGANLQESRKVWI